MLGFCRRSIKWKKLSISLLLLLFLAFGAEIISCVGLNFFCIINIPWTYDPHLSLDDVCGWSLNPYATCRVKSSVKGYDVVYRTTNGFRKDEQNITNVSDSDIVLIGDSHTFGYGLDEDQTLAVKLHRLYKKNNETKLVLNAGVPGYGLGQYYLRFLSLEKIKPSSMVIFIINPLNDFL